ncbi:MAG: pilus assembly protein [Selenomonadaceae bacterium]|nr:pilus assembly protein [Selenomonadaceae bacterium]
MQCKDFIGKPSGNPRKNFLQRGQVIILYALLIPLMFLFVGIGLDLGWYYLNVSRLQNAADAAALAGATELVVKSKVTDIKTISLVDKYDNNPADIDTIDGDAVAAQYARENLSSDELSVPLTDDERNTLLTLCTTTGVSAATRPSQ